MPLRGDRLRMTTSPRVTLGSWKKSWLVVHCSWLVKACHYTRMGCGRISQRDALWASPTHKAVGRVFLWPVTAFIPIACMRFRTSRRIFRRASRYALRVSRSVVVNLSLSRRNAASESEERPRRVIRNQKAHH